MNIQKSFSEIVSTKDMPAFFQVTDKVSYHAQKNYLRLMQSNIFLLVLSAALSVYSFSDISTRKVLAMLSAIMLFASIITTWLIHVFRYEKIWYEGRAVAESIKSLSWRYMTCADPYFEHLPLAMVDKDFLALLWSIIHDRKDLPLVGDEAEMRQISDKMHEIRRKSLDERKNIYLTERIEDQRKWYATKAKMNQSWENRWFAGIIITQLLAFICAILVINFPNSAVNMTGLFSTIATSALAWMQVKRHQELSKAYSITAQELSIIAESCEHVQNENEFSDFVINAETAISREHKLWLSRRIGKTD